MHPSILLIKLYFSQLKKLFFVGFTLSVILILFNYFLINKVPKINPQTAVVNSRELIYQAINEQAKDKSQHSRAALVTYRFFTCAFIGEACTNNPSDGDENYSKSIFGLASNAIVLPFQNPPASGAYWTYAGLQNSGFIPKTYAAQGIGFSGLQPFAPIWKLFRDFAYFLIVIFVVIIGFLIMFRFKINAQTVISLENALPRIFVTLLLITFSFPIAGFMIDLMYLTTSLIINIMAGNGLWGVDPSKMQLTLFAGNSGALFDQVFWNGNYWGVGPALLSVLPSMVDSTIRTIVASVIYVLLMKFTPIGHFLEGETLRDLLTSGGIPKTILAGIIAAVVFPIMFFITPILLSLIVFLTGLFVFFRIFFMLFKAYIRLILYIVFAPLMLLFHAIPGQKSFSKWVKSLTADLLTFPITVSLLMLSAIIVSVGNAGGKLVDTPNGGENLWRPPFLTNSSDSGFSILIGVGILFLIPEIIKNIKGFLGLKPSPLQPGFGLFFGGASAVGGGAGHGLGKFHQLGMSAHMVSNFVPKGKVQEFLKKFSPYGSH